MPVTERYSQASPGRPNNLHWLRQPIRTLWADEDLQVRPRSRNEYTSEPVSGQAPGTSKNAQQSSERVTWKNRMQKMLFNEKTADVHFVVGETKEKIPAHAAVLAAASESFEVMFFGDFDRPKTVDVPDGTSEGFKALLKYIYLDEIVFSMDNALSAFYLSKKYMVTSFQDDVLDYIRKNLSAANVCQYLPATQLFDELHD
ncbi:Btbd6 protein, partial [Aphelenchoides avenae]